MQILIPALNLNSQLVIAIKSILNGDYCEPQEIYVVWDNGVYSKEIETEIRQLQVRFFVNQNSLGVAQALNSGLENMPQGIVRRLDADDLLIKSTNVDLTQEIRGKAKFLCEEAVTFYPSGKIKRSLVPRLSTGSVSRLSFLAGNPISHPTVSFRKETVDYLGRYSTSNCAEDFDLWLTAYLSGFTFLYSGNPGVLYRRSSDQISNSLSPSTIASQEFEKWNKLIGDEFGLNSEFLEMTLCRGRSCSHSQEQALEYEVTVLKLISQLRKVLDENFTFQSRVNVVARLCISIVYHSKSRPKLSRSIATLFFHSPLVFIKIGLHAAWNIFANRFLSYEVATSRLFYKFSFLKVYL